MDTPISGFSFGERLRFVREDLSMTKTAMAKSMKVSVTTWSNYEKDKTFPREETINLFCRIYHVNNDWLMQNEGEVYQTAEEIEAEENMEETLRQFTIDKLVEADAVSSAEEAGELYDRTREKHRDMKPEALSMFVLMQAAFYRK